MEFYESRATIDALPEAVWAVLVNGVAWPSWDSGVISVAGSIAPGSKITIKSSAAPERAFPVRVTEFVPAKRLVFSGGMPLGLFKGVRTYSLDAVANSTQFRMREEYTGAMLGMIFKSMPDLSPSFAQFANGLKARVESGA